VSDIYLDRFIFYFYFINSGPSGPKARIYYNYIILLEFISEFYGPEMDRGGPSRLKTVYADYESWSTVRVQSCAILTLVPFVTYRHISDCPPSQ